MIFNLVIFFTTRTYIDILTSKLLTNAFIQICMLNDMLQYLKIVSIGFQTHHKPAEY